MEYYPEVVQAVAGEGYAVFAYFSDGSIRQYDIEPLVASGGVFERLADRAFFTERLTVMNGTVAWDVTGDRDDGRCIDLDPFTVYENARIVPDPLDEVA